MLCPIPYEELAVAANMSIFAWYTFKRTIFTMYIEITPSNLLATVFVWTKHLHFGAFIKVSSRPFLVFPSLSAVWTSIVSSLTSRLQVLFQIYAQHQEVGIWLTLIGAWN